jgi:hypothetical protein
MKCTSLKGSMKIIFGLDSSGSVSAIGFESARILKLDSQKNYISVVVITYLPSDTGGLVVTTVVATMTVSMTGPLPLPASRRSDTRQKEKSLQIISFARWCKLKLLDRVQ